MPKTTSLIKSIESYMRMHRRWLHGEEITKYAQSLGYEGETGRRRLRNLVEAEIVETESRKGKRTRSNWYRFVR